MSYCAQPLAVHCSCRTNFFGFGSINVAINLYLWCFLALSILMLLYMTWEGKGDTIITSILD